MLVRNRLRSLRNANPLYFLPQDPLAEEVLIPGFRSADTVDCMVGFFSSAILASLAPGFASYVSNPGHRFRLIVSPLLQKEDTIAIEEGVRSVEFLAEKILEDLVITEDLLQRHTLKCLSWLLRAGRIEIRVALMKDALFHPKVWLFGEDDDLMAVHGSSNVTYAGIRKNVEQIAVSKSWEDACQKSIAEKLQSHFIQLWENNNDSCIVIPIPQAVKEKIIQTDCSDSPPTEAEFRELLLIPKMFGL